MYIVAARSNPDRIVASGPDGSLASIRASYPLVDYCIWRVVDGSYPVGSASPMSKAASDRVERFPGKLETTDGVLRIALIPPMIVNNVIPTSGKTPAGKATRANWRIPDSLAVPLSEVVIDFTESDMESVVTGTVLVLALNTPIGKTTTDRPAAKDTRYVVSVAGRNP